MKKSKYIIKLEKIRILLLFIVILFICIYVEYENEQHNSSKEEIPEISYELLNIPVYDGKTYVVINDNIPNFSEEDMQVDEYYSNLKNGRVRNGHD